MADGKTFFVVGILLLVAASLYSNRRSVGLIKLHRAITGERGCAPLRKSLGNVTLHYFASRGRAEVVRLALEEAEIPYTETGFTKDTWPAAKQEGLKSGLYPFGLVPAIVTEGGDRIPDSQAILRFIARASNMDCECEDSTMCDVFARSTEDFRKQRSTLVYDPDFTPEKRLEYLTTGKAKQWMGYFEKLAPSADNKPNDNSHAYFVGDHITWIDILIFDLLDDHVALSQMDGLEKVNILADFPRLRAFHSGFSRRPNIAAYLHSDRRLPYTIPYSEKLKSKE
ncbi:glutathione S-transferase-like [Corticium candelabrum]|uniref:glutathione S-transferase-like n=1 Tax=Corticium candelabrum TaxID=121492 RepID=UPI002E271964|nr:glutathione S-transferase-like [Corticium candelabrum]